MKIVWRLLARFYETRSDRAARKSREFRVVAEKFFNRIKGVRG